MLLAFTDTFQMVLGHIFFVNASSLVFSGQMKCPAYAAAMEKIPTTTQNSMAHII